MIRLKLPLTVEEDLTLSFWILLVNLLILLGGAGNGEEETKTLSTRTEERSQAGPSSLDFRLFQHWLLGFQLRLHVCNSIGCRPKCVQALLQAVLQRSYCILGTPKRSKKALQFYHPKLLSCLQSHMFFQRMGSQDLGILIPKHHINAKPLETRALEVAFYGLELPARLRARTCQLNPVPLFDLAVQAGTRTGGFENLRPSWTKRSAPDRK